MSIKNIRIEHSIENYPPIPSFTKDEFCCRKIFTHGNVGLLSPEYRFNQPSGLYIPPGALLDNRDIFTLLRRDPNKEVSCEDPKLDGYKVYTLPRGFFRVRIIGQDWSTYLQGRNENP